MTVVFPLLLFSSLSRAAGLCGLPQTPTAAGTTLSGPNYVATVSVGVTAASASESVSAAGTVLGVGPQFASRGGYACFLSTNAPLGVAALPGTTSVQRLVPSAQRTMTLEWTPSFNPLPVTYTVYVSTDPQALSVYAFGVSATSQLLGNLQYQTPYYWQIIVSDSYGRTSPSNVYSFSIAAVTSHLIAAPNPFHPGSAPTVFEFIMAGAGTADMEIFSLPDGRRVFHAQLSGLQDGANLYSYDGRDDRGAFLTNGVYSVRLNKHGAQGNETERFKIVSVR